jgi:hypothetical protein
METKELSASALLTTPLSPSGGSCQRRESIGPFAVLLSGSGEAFAIRGSINTAAEFVYIIKQVPVIAVRKSRVLQVQSISVEAVLQRQASPPCP